MNDDARALAANLASLTGETALLVDLDDRELPEFLEGDVRLVVTDVKGFPGESGEFPPSPWQDAGPPADRVLLAAPKSRSRLECLVSYACSRARPGGTVTVVAPNRGAGVARTVVGKAGPLRTLEPKAHRKVFQVDVAEPPAFRLDDWRTESDVDTAAGPLRLVWYPGVFAEGRLDPASALLLEHLPDQAGLALDIGTGCGVLTVALSRIARQVVGVEADCFAVEATKATLAANDAVAEIRNDFRVPEALEDAPGYDLVVSNPPFHEGLRTTTATTETLLRDAAARLAPGGEVRIVANRFLPYERTLEETVGRSELLADDGRYRVWRAWIPAASR